MDEQIEEFGDDLIMREDFWMVCSDERRLEPEPLHLKYHKKN
jgi:hypothetical protein